MPRPACEQVCQYLGRRLANRLRRSQCLFGSVDGAILLTDRPEVEGLERKDACQPRLVIQRRGDGFRFVEQLETALKFAERRERSPQAEPQIDCLPHDSAALRQTLDRRQRLGKPRRGLTMGRFGGSCARRMAQLTDKG